MARVGHTESPADRRSFPRMRKLGDGDRTARGNGARDAARMFAGIALAVGLTIAASGPAFGSVLTPPELVDKLVEATPSPIATESPVAVITDANAAVAPVTGSVPVPAPGTTGTGSGGLGTGVTGGTGGTGVTGGTGSGSTLGSGSSSTSGSSTGGSVSGGSVGGGSVGGEVTGAGGFSGQSSVRGVTGPSVAGISGASASADEPTPASLSASAATLASNVVSLTRPLSIPIALAAVTLAALALATRKVKGGTKLDLDAPHGGALGYERTRWRL